MTFSPRGGSSAPHFEPMGFVAERPCPFQSEQAPYDDPEHFWVEPTEKRIFGCDKKAYRVVGAHNPEISNRRQRALGLEPIDEYLSRNFIVVCEHMGRLVE